MALRRLPLKVGVTFPNVVKLGVIFKSRKRGKNSEGYY